jgi:hypothetical protein
MLRTTILPTVEIVEPTRRNLQRNSLFQKSLSVDASVVVDDLAQVRTRINPTDAAAPRTFQVRQYVRPLPVKQTVELAATALTNGLTLVTRNDRDVAGLGAIVFNPFKGAKNDR